MMKKIKLFIFPILFSIQLFAQKDVAVYPTNWWAGMKNPRLQLMLHGDAIANSTISINYPGLQLVKVAKVENKNYLFADLMLSSSIKPGIVKIHIKNGAAVQDINYELKPRRKGNGTQYAQGVTAKDFIYLLMPDRFSNGDYSNDKIAGMKDQKLDRDSIFLRHGGDMQGVTNHLDYLQDLGVTTLWMTPVLENDEPNRTEHGYKCTNHYKIEPRFGGEAAYLKLSDELHKRGMKLIQDAVYNHVGINHFTIQDMPMKDWVHQWPKFTHPDYKDQTLFDPYGAAIDRKYQTNGWFEKNMPDLNQSNPYVANFLIQHAIWSVEQFGVDGWRIDTYIYVNQDFMNRCNQALMDEYPKMTMFGEAWVNGTLNEAVFTQNNLNIPFKSNATGVTDFQCLFDGIRPAVKEPGNGVNRLYQTLSNDVLYKNPLNNVIFLDNHDMTRFYSEVGEDVDKLKMGLGWLLTARGTPQMYYGTEILMTGISNPDGLVRLDFPGGWKDDKMNKFTAAGRTEKENDLFNFTKTIANFRKKSTALTTGKTMQYVPQNSVYTYFRYDNNQTVMVIMNTANEEKTVDTKRFEERTATFSKAHNIVTGASNNLSDSWKVPAKTIWIMELSK